LSRAAAGPNLLLIGIQTSFLSQAQNTVCDTVKMFFFLLGIAALMQCTILVSGNAFFIYLRGRGCWMSRGWG